MISNSLLINLYHFIVFIAYGIMVKKSFSKELTLKFANHICKDADVLRTQINIL